MSVLQFKILAKRQELRDTLIYAVRQLPVNLLVVRSLRNEIAVCDYALNKLASLNKVKSG